MYQVLARKLGRNKCRNSQFVPRNHYVLRTGTTKIFFGLCLGQLGSHGFQDLRSRMQKDPHGMQYRNSVKYSVAVHASQSRQRHKPSHKLHSLPFLDQHPLPPCSNSWLQFNYVLCHTILSTPNDTMKVARTLAAAAATAVHLVAGPAVRAFSVPRFSSVTTRRTTASQLSMVLEKPTSKKLAKIEVLKIQSDHLLHPLVEVRVGRTRATGDDGRVR
jgi:hypothetical protein